MGLPIVNRLVVASLQMGMNMPLTKKEFRAEFERFLKVAVHKQSDLVVGSELGAAMIGLPFVDRRHRESLLNIRKGQHVRAGLLTRIRSSAERWNPRWSEADTPKLLQEVLHTRKEEIWEFYDSTFGRLAAEYEIVLVAPSAWLADPLDGKIRNIACVYDRDGQRAGYQAKVLVDGDGYDPVRPGVAWKPIDTSVGVLGVALGHDCLWPEVGRLFATQGASLLIGQMACTSDVQWGRGHRAAVMRCVENQLFGCLSCLVGADRIHPEQERVYRGRSMLLAPLELSPQQNGVLVSMEDERREGLVVSTLDYTILRQNWQETEPGFREQFTRIWNIYISSPQTIEETDRMLPEQSLAEDMDDEDVAIVESYYVDEEPQSAPDESAHNPYPPPEPDDEDESLVTAAVLDDLEVVHAVVRPWREVAPIAKPARLQRRAYHSRGNLDETQELDSVEGPAVSP